MNKKIVLASVLIVLGAGILWANSSLFGKSDSCIDKEDCFNEEATNRPVESESDKSVVPWKVGELIGGLTVASIGPVSNEEALGPYNVMVVFTGEHPIEGTLKISEESGPAFDVSGTFRGSLPCGSNLNRINSSCDTLAIINSKELGLDELMPGDSLKLKAIITEYRYISYPTDGGLPVTLKNVVRE